MHSHEKVSDIFNHNTPYYIPAAPHWWGLFKFQLAGIASDYENQYKCSLMSGEALAQVDSLFYETFRPDWFQLNCGYNSSRDEYKKSKLIEIVPHVKCLESKAIIDEYLNLQYMNIDEIIKSGIYGHVKILSSKYGDQVFIAMNEGNPICNILDPKGLFGFEDGLINLIEKPKLMEYLIFCSYEKMIDKIRVLKEYGCHGFIGSETYCTPDLISPSTYRNLIFPAQKYFYNKVNEIGLIPIVYFLGDINLLIADINRLDVKALMIEESKKTFILDALDIRKRLAGEITLFGNLDSVYTLLYGTKETVIRETIKQLEAAKYGKFVMSNGCPLAFDTPKENILAMIETSHNFKEEF